MKQCQKCGETKDITDFGRMSASKDGHQPLCRLCANAQQQKWRRANPENVLAHKRRYRATHREEINAYKMEVYYRNVERNREKQRLWKRANPEHVATRSALYEERRRWMALERVHGLSPDQYYDMHDSQGGVCAICRTPLPRSRLSNAEAKAAGVAMAHVDHDHATDMIRGILCSRCNQAIGLLDERPEVFAAAVAYLQSPPSQIIPDRAKRSFPRTRWLLPPA